MKARISDPPTELYLASAEDIVLQKLFWFRLGGGVSDRQWGDALGVLQVQGRRIDLTYLRELAREMGVVNLPRLPGRLLCRPGRWPGA